LSVRLARCAGRTPRGIPTVLDFGNKKAPAHKEKGRQNGCALLIFPKLMMLELELAPVTGTEIQSVAVVSPGQSLDHSL